MMKAVMRLEDFFDGALRRVCMISTVETPPDEPSSFAAEFAAITFVTNRVKCAAVENPNGSEPGGGTDSQPLFLGSS
jgi:hypothetical protein